MIDELHVKQNILQSDIDIVVKNLCDLFSKNANVCNSVLSRASWLI
jgi:uncharacterized protein YoxC